MRDIAAGPSKQTPLETEAPIVPYPHPGDRARKSKGDKPEHPNLAQIVEFSNRGTFQLAEARCAKGPPPTVDPAKATPTTEEPETTDAPESPEIDEPAVEAPRSNPFLALLKRAGAIFEPLADLLGPRTVPGEVTKPYQALAYGPEQGGEGSIVMLPLSVLDNRKLRIKPNIIVFNPVLNTRRLLGNTEEWTLEQLLEESKRLRVELLWTQNDDGDQIIIEGNHSSAQHAPLGDQTVHVHTHPYVPPDMFHPENNSGSRLVTGFSPNDLKVYRDMPGVARIVLTDDGKALLYLDTKMKDSGTATWSTPSAPCATPDPFPRG